LSKHNVVCLVCGEGEEEFINCNKCPSTSPILCL